MIKGKPSLLYWYRGGGYGGTPIDPVADNGKTINVKSKTAGYITHQYPWMDENDLFRRRASNVVNLTDEEIMKALKMGLELKEPRAGIKDTREKKKLMAEHAKRFWKVVKQYEKETGKKAKIKNLRKK